MLSAATLAEHGGKRLSLRLKLTLWMLTIFMIVQFCLALVYNLYQIKAIDQIFTSGQATRARAVVEEIRDMAPEFDDRLLALELNRQFWTEESLLEVRDEHGAVLGTTRRPGFDVPMQTVISALKDGVPVVLVVPSASLPGVQKGREAARAVLHPFSGADGRTYLAVLARVEVRASQMRSLATRIILITIPIGLLATGIAAYVIAGILVRPLTTIRTLAEQIGPDSIQTEVGTRSEPPEVAAVREELERARQRIEQGFAVQERFMSNVSHELKTPIATILTEVQVLHAEGVTQPVRDFIRSLREELERLGRTVDSFLLLTRARHGKRELRSVEACQVREVLVDSYAGCSGMAKQHGVVIELRLQDGDSSDAAVMGNADLLRTIFDNLIRNAVRFSPAGGVVSVGVEVARDEAYITVRDRGPGIPEEILPRIFDRFAQAKDEEKRGRGHGLGLEIAQGLAELHQGTITVRNHPDGGCEFTVRLPVTDPNVEFVYVPKSRG